MAVTLIRKCHHVPIQVITFTYFRSAEAKKCIRLCIKIHIKLEYRTLPGVIKVDKHKQCYEIFCFLVAAQYFQY